MASDDSDGSTNSNNMTNHRPERSITLRFIVNMKEAGGIIGKGGENIKRFREESGARINISDPSTSERIVAVVGFATQIKKAFELIAEKFEEDISLESNGRENSQVTFRLILPNANCGSLIGKSGANIKELRESSGATIQVANELLPHSTERNVNIAGSIDSIMKVLNKICSITAEAKLKGPQISYQPTRMGGMNGPMGSYGGGSLGGMYNGFRQGGSNPNLSSSYGGLLGNGRNDGRGAGRNQYGGGGGGIGDTGLSLASVPYPALDYPSNMGMVGGGRGLYGSLGGRIETREIVISNDVVGALIGRQGSRISEIRVSSGAMVKIADADENGTDRRVIISGPTACVKNASYLIKNFCTRYKTSRD